MGARLLVLGLLSLPACGTPDAEPVAGEATPAATGESVEETTAPVERFAAMPEGDRVFYLDSRPEGGEHDAPVLLLVHGWASDHRVWRQQLSSLDDRFRLLAVDLPAHGRSDVPVQPLSMDLFAEALVAVLDDAGVDEAVAVGHSNGTPTVRQLYRRAPERVTALVVVDGPLLRVFPEDAVPQMVERFEGADWRENLRAMLEGMSGQASRAGGGDSEIPDPETAASDEGAAGASMWSDIVEMAVSQSHEAVLGGFLASAEAAIWQEDPIDVPVLAVLAAQPTWSDDYLEAARELAPEIEVDVQEGVGHFLMMEQPERFDALLLDFLERHGSVDGD